MHPVIECDTLCLVRVVVKILFCVIQAEMAITYAFKANDGSEREAVGSILLAFWALWATYVMLKGMNILFTNSEEETLCEQAKEDR